MMSENRFERWNDYSCKVKDNQEDTFLNLEDVVDKLNELTKENERLHKQVNNLQEALAESWATLIMEGFEIEFDGKNLGKDCAKWIGVDEENLYDVVR